MSVPVRQPEEGIGYRSEERKKKKMRKLVQKCGVFLLIMVMILAVGRPAAADASGENVSSGQGSYEVKDITTYPQETDTVQVTINGLDGGETVTLYKIAGVEYGTGSQTGYVELKFVDGITERNLTPSAPTSEQITEIVQKIGNEIRATRADVQTLQDSERSYSATVGAGVYIAVIKGRGSVYNPVYLTATYGTKDDALKLLGGKLDLSGADNKYLYGLSGTAKKSTPKISKTVSKTQDEKENGEIIQTASVGDVVSYELIPTMPDYPANASNKTLYIQDKFPEGVTFLFNSLEIELTDGNGPVAVTKKYDAGSEKYIYKIGSAEDGKIIAEAKKVDTDNDSATDEFRILFTYNNLISNSKTGVLYGIKVRYNGVLNKDTVVGARGNKNEVTLKYSTTPTSGSTWDGLDNEPTEGIGTDRDEAIVYTYQLAFKKVGEGKDAKALAGAVFGIYSDPDCEELVDVVETNENGLAVSNQVGKGTYYLKELGAPVGYSRNEQVYHMTASWTSATRTVHKETVAYSTEQPDEDAKPVGWLVGDVFYKTKPADADALPAYIVGGSHASLIKSITPAGANGGGQADALLNDKNEPVESIPNTKLVALPSTGGMGIYIFTCAGVAVMAIMAFLFLKGRRREDE